MYQYFYDFSDFLQLCEVERVDEVETLDEHTVTLLNLHLLLQAFHNVAVPEHVQQELVQQSRAMDEGFHLDELFHHFHIYMALSALGDEVSQHLKVPHAFHLLLHPVA
jgi:hypothetical protein